MNSHTQVQKKGFETENIPPNMSTSSVSADDLHTWIGGINGLTSSGMTVRNMCAHA
jgi:hypothetical protein